MTTEQPRSANVSGIVSGVMVMLLGAVLLLGQLDVVNWRNAWRFWPIVLIGLGIAKLVARQGNGLREGVFQIFLGTWLLLNLTGVLRWRDSWPFVIVAVGVSIVWGALFGNPRPDLRHCKPHHFDRRFDRVHRRFDRMNRRSGDSRRGPDAMGAPEASDAKRD
jgi:hypothetical protein